MADINNFIDPKLIDSLIKINDLIIKNGQSIDTVLLPAIKKLEEAQSKLGKNTKDNAAERKKLTASQKESARIAKQLETTEAKLLSLQKGQQDALIKTKTELQKTTAAKKKELTSTNALTGSYIKINAELNKNIARYKGLSSEQRKNSKVGGQLLTTIQRQDKALKKLDTQMGRSQRNVGNYSSAFRSLIGAFGVTGGILGFVSVLRSAGNTIAQFDKAQATTAATLGKTKKEIDALTKSAIELGRVTQFTATEVSILQNELAKLGFTSEEIVASTGGILDLAAATDSGLGEAAKVAGAALRAFGLDATEMNRVVSVLAVATTKTALSFEDYATGLSNVAPVAKAFGFSIEDTVALFGKLRDAGFDASKATTATRNIILNLADSSSALSESLGGPIKDFNEFIPAMIKLRESGVDLNTTLQLTDKRSVAAFNQFLEGAESAKVLRDSLIDVNDELVEMVETRTDNVVGAWARLGSAWEGFILRFRDSSGFFKDFFDETATLINAWGNENISTWKKVTELVFRQATKEQEIQDKLARSLRTATKDQLELSIRNNEERLSNGNKFDQNLLKMTKDRLAELEAAEIASAQKIIDDAAAAKTKADAKNEDERIKSALELQAAKLGIEVETTDTIIELQKKITKEEKKQSKERIKIAQKEQDAKTKILRGEADDFLRMSESSRKKRSKQNKEDRDTAIKLSESGGKLELEKLDERNKKVTENNQTTVDNEVKNRMAAFDDEQMQAQATKEAAIQGASELGNTLFDLKTAGLQREFEAAQGNAKKQAEISKKIAEQEKKKALFNIAINTAVAVVKALPNIPLSIIVGGLGLIQAGIVAAKPIPQFAKGTDSAPGGVAELAEKGRERVINPDGTIWTAENRGLYNLQQGSKVLTNTRTTQAELNDKRIVDELKLTRKAIQRQPRQRTESQFDKRQRGMKDGYHMMKNRLN